MEPPTITAGTTTWTAQILAHRRLEILQKLSKAFPAISKKSLQSYAQKYVAQPINYDPSDLLDNLDNS